MSVVKLTVVALIGEVLGVGFQQSRVEVPTKPTTEYQNLMRSNASLIDLSVGPTGLGSGSGTSIESRVSPVEGSKTLRDLFKAKDFDGLAKGAGELQSNYEKLVTFWTGQKAEDAIQLAKTGAKAAADMQAAAKIKSEKSISDAQTIIERTCRDCHTTHRVIMLTDSSFQIRIAPNQF